MEHSRCCFFFSSFSAFYFNLMAFPTVISFAHIVANAIIAHRHISLSRANSSSAMHCNRYEISNGNNHRINLCWGWFQLVVFFCVAVREHNFEHTTETEKIRPVSRTKTPHVYNFVHFHICDRSHDTFRFSYMPTST